MLYTITLQIADDIGSEELVYALARKIKSEHSDVVVDYEVDEED